MRTLVLGGCGFIGSHVVDRLLAAGQNVRVMDRGPEKFRAPLPQVEYVVGDFSDGSAVVEAMADVDIVLHLVSATVPGTAALDPGADVSRNLLPTIHLLENMRKVRVPRLVYLSSGGAVYGVPEVIPTPEEHPLRPTNSYGIVKAAIEHYVRMYSGNESLAATIIRPSNPYGPRQGHTGIQGVVATFLRRLQNDEPLTVWGDGTVVRDYLFIDDLADLVVKAILSDATGVYNAGSGKGVSINGLIETLREVTGKSVPVTYKEARPVDVPTSILDIRRANDAFGWEPQTAFSDGVRLHWDWMANL